MNTTPELRMWPVPSTETRPWTRWWWLGSAVNKPNITRLLEEYRRVGLGGVEITPIYGVKGRAKQNLAYLSPEWCDMVRYTLQEARRLGMRVDLPPGSGWKMGGAFLPAELRAARVRFSHGAVEVATSGENIKRPGPGGGGPAFNPFDRASLQAVMDHFTPVFRDLGIRAQFHDSWEYDANAPFNLLSVFAERYGYRLEDHAEQDPLPPRVRYDLQLLLANLALEAFILPWTDWCHELRQLSRNQAHGSPGNLLDLYAACDIPETEVFRQVTPDTPLISKFASSAAHVTGRPLVSSETGTWIQEHFHVTLGDMKTLCDNLFVSGINHHVYHGTCYSPEEAEWPGWLFYASAQLNPQNPVWRDFPALNTYVTRCQSLLQQGAVDHDLLVYFPLHDILHDPDHKLGGKLTIEGEWLKKLEAMNTLRQLWNQGYAFDYISDRQIAELAVDEGRLRSPGGSYRALLIPTCTYLPVETLEQLTRLDQEGAEVLFQEPGPRGVPGFSGLGEKQTRFQFLIERFQPVQDLPSSLASAGVIRECLCDLPGLRFIRRNLGTQTLYFLVNERDRMLDEWIELSVKPDRAVLLDPMTGDAGNAVVRENRLRVQLEPGASLLVQTDTRCNTDWLYYTPAGEPVDLTGPWQVRFLSGGPELPESYTTETLESWSARGGTYEAFAGTAEYRFTFDSPGPGASWLLDLGQVDASARVRLNGKEIAALIGPTFRVMLTDVKPTGNRLAIEVTSLAANRIRDLDRRGGVWRIFEDINFVNRDYKPFDASNWAVEPAGLIGPVRLQPLR